MTTLTKGQPDTSSKEVMVYNRSNAIVPTSTTNKFHKLKSSCWLGHGTRSSYKSCSRHNFKCGTKFSGVSVCRKQRHKKKRTIHIDKTTWQIGLLSCVLTAKSQFFLSIDTVSSSLLSVMRMCTLYMYISVLWPVNHTVIMWRRLFREGEEREI